jgi:hypothetical protein
MFCDLVGSTSLATKLDPEDWRNLVNTYLDESTRLPVRESPISGDKQIVGALRVTLWAQKGAP